MKRPIRGSLLTLAAMLGLSGCTLPGPGITRRAFDHSWSQLTAGTPQAEILAQWGEPRERRAAPGATSAYDEIWIYTWPETVGHETRISEGAITRSGVSLPTYEEVPITANVAYHLRWQNGHLVSWERIAP